MKKLTIGILASGRGTILPKIVEAINDGTLNAKIAIIITNKSNAYILQRARQFSINAKCIPSKGMARLEHEQLVARELQKYNIDLILLLGYMRILSAEFISGWRGKILNIHPSLLPDFAGKMDLEVHKAVLSANKKETGCTVHVVNEVVDGGRIIVQKRCRVKKSDTPESLKKRVQELEAEALIEALLLNP